ncbi:hypothetical protein ElyMa_003469900 [Elysia marginata]|uniref:Uncharacterized protein n=1 Tax=Elysia marginata TaxID=1093978 RepID=A0AAV4EAJ3_9GAST|nr:hypothetical protein ElyMa_003469900 [Elysia marginata]
MVVSRSAEGVLVCYQRTDSFKAVVENVLLNDTDNLGVDIDSTRQLQSLLTSSPVVAMRIPTKCTVTARIDTSTTPTMASETAKETCLTTLSTKAAAVEEETPSKPTREGCI